MRQSSLIFGLKVLFDFLGGVTARLRNHHPQLNTMRALRICAIVIVPAIGATAAEQWSEVRSPHFLIITDGGEKRGREVALRFEQMRIAFGAIFNKLTVNIPIPVEVIGFKNTRELRRYSPLWNGKPVELAGYFQPGQEKDFIALDLSAESGWHVVYHEYTHLLMHSNMGEMPVWFDEGFADYFSSVKIDSKRMELGGVLESHAYLLSQNRWMPLVTLFSIRHDSPEYNEKGDHRSMLYAESWLVVHYLMGTKKVGQLSTYMTLVNDQHVPVAEAIEKAFGMPPAKFEKTLQDYLRHTIYFPIPAPSGIDNTSGYVSKVIGETEAAAALADLHMHERDYQEAAVKEFEDVLAKQPDNGVAHRGLGYAFLRKHDYRKAEEHFGKAVEVNPADAEGHYFYALLMVRRSGAEMYGSDKESYVKIGSGDSSQMIAVKKQLEAAIALNPQYAEAYNLLAIANAQASDFAAAAAAEAHALQFDRHNEMYALNLGQYYMAGHKWSDAEAVLRQLVNSTNASTATTAQNHLQNIATMQKFDADPQTAIAVNQQRMFDHNDSSPDGAAGSVSGPEPPPHPTPVEFVKGKLVKVDCAANNGATLTIAAGRANWTLSTTDRKTVVLIGTDSFSCDWHNIPVAVNFRKTGENQGSIMSLEVQ